MTAVGLIYIIQANKASFCLATKPHDHMQYFLMWCETKNMPELPFFL